MGKEKLLLNEKYRPDKLEDMIKTNFDYEYFENVIKEKRLKNHILLTGNAGIGKTTLSKILVKELNADSIWINASLERGIDTIREEIVSFAHSKSFGGIPKIIQLEECDSLTQDAWKALRPIMEEYSGNVLFIATCNYPENIPAPLLSRFEKFEFKQIPKNDMINRIKQILDYEEINYSIDKFDYLYRYANGDMRSMINFVQKHTINKIFKINEIDNLLTKFVDAYKMRSKEKIKDFFDEFSVDFNFLYRILFENENNPNKLILITSYMNSKRVDEEITLTALIYELWKIEKSNGG